MNRDKRDAQKHDNRDSTGKAKQPNSESGQCFHENQDQEKPENTRRAEETRFESSNSGNEDRVCNTPNQQERGSDSRK